MKHAHNRLLWAVSLGHMTNDIFMSIGPVVLAFLSAHFLHISAAQIGAALSARQFMGAVSQPLFGWISDRTGGRLQAAGGVTWVAVMMMLSVALSLTGQFWLMVIPYALSAVGSGAFHPVGAMYAAEARKERAAGNTAYFFLAGQTGLALGPFLAGLVLDLSVQSTDGVVTSANVLPLFALLILVVPGTLFMLFTIPKRGAQPTGQPSAALVSRISLRSLLAQVALGPLLILTGFVFLRSIVHIGVADFLPVLFRSKGWNPTDYGLITSAFWMASAISGVAFGWLADRHDRRHILVLSMVGGAPLLFALPLLDGLLAVVGALAAGALLGGSFPVVVVLAQSLLPGRKGFTSGLTLGFIFATGSLGSLIIGFLADATSLTITFQVVAGVAVAASLVALALPYSMSGRQKAVAEGSVGVATSGDR